MGSTCTAKEDLRWLRVREQLEEESSYVAPSTISALCLEMARPRQIRKLHTRVQRGEDEGASIPS